jgi:serine/threonine-protein kinase HipA
LSTPLEDFRACAVTTGLERRRAEAVLDEVRAVVARWPEYADEAELRPSQRDSIRETLRLDFDRR